MRNNYFLLLLIFGLAAQRAHAQATAWRPFRPGLVYSFIQTRGLATITPVHTLRVDSTYATAGGDSVYAFNRLLRPAGPSIFPVFKSRNNLLGARLRWHPGTSDYYLEANAEPALGGPAAPVALLLRPRAPVGSTWVASAQPALTATLSSRAPDAFAPTPDSVATITLSNGQVLLLSRRRGLLQGPQWLALPASGGKLPTMWQQSGGLQAGLGPYDPRVLFALGVGDEVGYQLTAPLVVTLPCQSGYRLRRIVARQLTADSLLLTYKEQDRVTTTAVPGCSGTPGTVVGAIRQGRWAFSLRTGASPQWIMGLLAGEYRPVPGSTAALFMGRGYNLQLGSGTCLDDPELLTFSQVYGALGQYVPGIDYLAVNQNFSALLGVGPTYFTDYYDNYLAYYRRGTTSCGQPANFAGLLPTRAAQAAAAATLAPNPATEVAMLTLAAPTLPGTTLTLTDALGRRVWSQLVAAGQTSLAVPLAGQPTGLYLVQLLTPAAPYLTWKLVKQDQ